VSTPFYRHGLPSVSRLDGTPSSLAYLGKVSSFVQVKTVESFLHHSHRPARRWRSSLPSSALHHTNHVNHHHSISTPLNVFSTHHDTTQHNTAQHNTTRPELVSPFVSIIAAAFLMGPMLR
jgi:hypothetical protein